MEVAEGGKTVAIAKKTKKAPRYLYNIERGHSLSIRYNSTGKPSIVEAASGKIIGWVKEMKALGFNHMRTPEGHHLFFKNKMNKVPMMIASLKYTVAHSPVPEEVVRAKDVLTWKTKFIVMNDGVLTWAKSYKAVDKATSESASSSGVPDMGEVSFPALEAK